MRTSTKLLLWLLMTCIASQWLWPIPYIWVIYVLAWLSLSVSWLSYRLTAVYGALVIVVSLSWLINGHINFFSGLLRLGFMVSSWSIVSAIILAQIIRWHASAATTKETLVTIRPLPPID